MTYRKLGVLLDGLPIESRFRTRLRNDTPRDLVQEQDTGPLIHGPWTLADQLLARIGDNLSMQRFEASDREGVRPKPYPRPGVDEVEPISPAAFDYMERLRANHGAVEVAAPTEA